MNIHQTDPLAQNPERSTHMPIFTLDKDPTPKDQAIYIPSVTPAYAISVLKSQWKRSLPQGISNSDLNFLRSDNKLMRLGHVMSSAGQALNQTQDCIITTRNHKQSFVIGDSGGYQIATGKLDINGDRDRLKILHWLEKHTDAAMTLDVPTASINNPHSKYNRFADCLKDNLEHLEFFAKHRTVGATRFLNVLQGTTTPNTDIWFDKVKHYPFEGWAFGGNLRHNFYNLCRRIIQMADQKLLQEKHWIHILGTNTLDTAIGLTALQRAINRHINPNLRISYDTSSPFRILGQWHQVYTIPKFSAEGMTLQSAEAPDMPAYVGSDIRFPWPSQLGDILKLSDICVVKKGFKSSTYDTQSLYYLYHHNLASLCNAIALANRVFDSESIAHAHNIARPVGSLVEAINQIIKVGTMDSLNKFRGTFNAVRAIQSADDDLDRRDLETSK